MGGDLKLAARILHAEAQSLVVVRSGRVLFRSRMSGIEPLLEALDYDVLAGSAVAEQGCAGRAAAMVAVTGQADSVYSWIMGAGAVGSPHCSRNTALCRRRGAGYSRPGRGACPVPPGSRHPVHRRSRKRRQGVAPPAEDLQQGAKYKSC